MHYKLDLGIDHVLIDEAQDTSPKQWEIVKRLVSEFTAGSGARGTQKRSIFAVGDDKQSIYSFQGAEPDCFAQMKRFFAGSFKTGGLGFLPVEFKHSFRSAPVILDAVDKVFERPEAFAGLTADPVKTVHEAVRAGAPGLVELWDIEQPADDPPAEGWQAPFDTISEISPRVMLAQRIAAAVQAWIARGDRVGDGEQRRPVTPGDILILVRQRGPLFEAIIRALKNANIAVAGADRLVLTEHIAVMDLIALADCLLLPEDDLALATVLKSPLFGFDDDDLFAIAWNRGPLPLRHSLMRKADNPRFREAAARLGELEAAARKQSPFAFYAGLLGADWGRKRILARLGLEAADALDEFLDLALDYESRETPSLQGFVAWLRSAGAEIKRDMEIARDEVRVMTVHGAKGLEAPFVILADTTTAPAGPAQRQPRLLTLPVTDAPARHALGLGDEQERRRGDCRAGAHRGAQRRRGRIPPSALCGDDTGRRPAHRLRRDRRARQARGLLVRSRLRRAQARLGGRAGRRRRGQGLALSQGVAAAGRSHGSRAGTRASDGSPRLA